jgi:hypothetical protein
MKEEKDERQAKEAGRQEEGSEVKQRGEMAYWGMAF